MTDKSLPTPRTDAIVSALRDVKVAAEKLTGTLGDTVIDDAIKRLHDLKRENAALRKALEDLVASDEQARSQGITGYVKGSAMWKKWEAARAALKEPHHD